MKRITSRQTQLVPPQVESVRRRLGRWRSHRKHPSRIPEELWASAAELAGSYGLAKTARALRLDYYSLKERLETRSQSRSPEANAPPSFVELVPQAGVAECTIELEDPAGARMRIHLKGQAVPDLTQLSGSFWRMGR
jgi:hypothetical protein